VRNMKFTSKTVVLTLIASLLVTVAAPSRAYAGFGDYTDIAGHWAAAALETLCDPVSRGKFAKYLVLGWNIQPYAGAEQFLSDVPPGNPFYVYANALYLRGLMVGSGGAFGVGASLTREQCATVLVRAAGLEPTAVMRPSAEAQAIVASAWTDAADISPWAIPYMAEAFVQELFKGDDAGTVRPLDPMSKAEAATVVSRIKNLKPLEDFGDAPDWPSYFGFPSLLTNDGARHQDYKQVWLGERADGEIDSRQIWHPGRMDTRVRGQRRQPRPGALRGRRGRPGQPPLLQPPHRPRYGHELGRRRRVGHHQSAHRPEHLVAR